MSLCFVSVLKTGLIRQECFLYCWAVLTHNQGPFGFLLHQSEGMQSGLQSTLHQQNQGVSHAIWHHAQPIKPGEGGRMFRVVAFTFSSNCYLSSAFLEILLMGSGERITWLACTAFGVTIKLPSTPPMGFLTFTLPILLPISREGSVGVSGADSPAGVRPWEQVSWGMDWHKRLHCSLTCSVIVQTVVLLIAAAVENPLQIDRTSPVTLFPCWNETHASRKNLN